MAFAACIFEQAKLISYRTGLQLTSRERERRDKLVDSVVSQTMRNDE